jgi:hypothetical protein
MPPLSRFYPTMTPRRQLSPQRQRVYCWGLCLTILGGLIVASVFVTLALHFDERHSNVWGICIGLGLIIAGLIILARLKRGNAVDEASLSAGAKRINHLPLDEQLRRLYQLRDDGIITEEEYTVKKRQILERM